MQKKTVKNGEKLQLHTLRVVPTCFCISVSQEYSQRCHRILRLHKISNIKD